ncbi:AIPR family protein [Peribacillus frigoritolerans]|uniref:AIPR family protein n=1 Tax=Peribacillus frigoritolerans TaxID=450367 RepID=UPI002226A101|nr:AIPR family protein [Peribacillus frigoritolerans]UYZ00741.1 AIPR family protein [Peribacillus frigoritolerans]
MSKTLLLDTVLREYASELDMNFEKEKDQVFEVFAAEQLLKNKDLDDIEIKNGLIGGSLDNGIDGLFVFIDDECINSIDQINILKKAKNIEIHIHQYKNTTKIDENVIHKFNTVASSIFDLDTEYSEEYWNKDLLEKIEWLNQIFIKTAASHPKYKVYFRHICKGDRSNIYNDENPNLSYIDKVKVIEKTLENCDLDNIDFDFDLIGRKELGQMNRVEKQFSLALKLNENPIALDYSEDGKRGYIASANLIDYYNFLSDSKGNLRNYLFDSNIRDFQNSTAVNKEISKTIKEEKKIDFWWLNNGVTIIADAGSLTGKTLNLDNIQIVNGLQTSYSIYNTIHELNRESDNRSLLLKIIITNRNDETGDKIIKSTNSQNHVPTSLLRATDSIQRDIEDYFLANDYFYDRRKNYYKNLKKPMKKIVSINFLAQCLTSIVISEKNPSKARSNPTILTKEDADYNELFNERRDLKVYLNSAKIVKKVEKIIKEQTFENEDLTEEQLKKYYLFHISRIAMSIEFGIPNYGEEKIKDVDIEKIDKIKIDKSIKVLKEILELYEKEKGHIDLVNISKQTEFSKFITANFLKCVSRV